MVTILHVRKSNVTWNAVTQPDVTMKARCIRSACNDKVFDASENDFDKTVSWGKNSILYNDVCVPRKKKPALPKIRVMVLPPYVFKCRKI